MSGTAQIDWWLAHLEQPLDSHPYHKLQAATYPISENQAKIKIVKKI